MRITFVGASNLAVMTAKLLIDRGHQVVMIDRDRARIDAIMGHLDCSFLCGDGGSPEILREADPKATDVLLCLTDSDQVNIIASLVGRSLGFKRVITSIADAEYEPICQELGLVDTVVPVRTISRFLADMLSGIDYVEFRTVVKADARLFSFTACEEDAGEVSALKLPSGAKVVWLYRDGKFNTVDESSQLQADDEVVIATRSDNLAALRDRWQA
jgi:trk system potassium uptake protein TrkA